MDSNQFAQQVKQKYPQYASIPNDQLTQAVIKKHPEYQSMVNPTAGMSGAMSNPQTVPQMPTTQQRPQQQAQRPPQQGLGQMDPSEMIRAYSRIDSQGAQDLLSKIMQTQLAPSTQKKNSPWRVVSGMLSKSGKPVQQNEETGEVREASLDVTPTGRGNSSYGAGSVNWDTATDEDKSLAKALYEGRVTPGALSYRDRGVAVKLANDYAIRSGLAPYKSYAGNVAEGTAKAFSYGKQGLNSLAINTALGHVSSAYDAYQQLQNTDEKWLNRPLNSLKKQTNDPNVVRLGVTLNALRGELATVFKGSGGTDQEISSWREYLTDDLTPSQINAVIPQIDELLRSRLSALDYSREGGMAGRGEFPLLSPKGSETSKRLGNKKSPPQKKDDFSAMSDDELRRIAAGQ